YFFFYVPATTPTYTLSLHDALPIFLPRPRLLGHDLEALLHRRQVGEHQVQRELFELDGRIRVGTKAARNFQQHIGLASVEKRLRSEEHTSEPQSRGHLVCSLRLEKK